VLEKFALAALVLGRVVQSVQAQSKATVLPQWGRFCNNGLGVVQVHKYSGALVLFQPHLQSAVSRDIRAPAEDAF